MRNEIKRILMDLVSEHGVQQHILNKTVDNLISFFETHIDAQQQIKNLNIPAIIKSVCVNEKECNIVLKIGDCLKQCPKFEPKQTVL